VPRRTGASACIRFRRLSVLREGGDMLGIANPYFRSHEGAAGA
jgi:hypothetical protein